MPQKNYDWSRIDNLEVRGKKRICQARVTVNGRTYRRTLGITADLEGRNAPLIREALRAYKAKLAQDHLAILQLTRTRSDYSKLSEIFAAYDEACASRRIGALSVLRTKQCTRRIIHQATGRDPNTTDPRAGIFTRDLAADFFASRIRAVKEEAAAAEKSGDAWTAEQLEKRLASAQVSAKTCLQQSKSLFARALLDSRPYRALQLPALDGFLRYNIAGSSLSRYKRPPAAVIEAIGRDLPALLESEPAQWLAFQLGVHSGLRRSSARNARWEWITENPDGSALLDVSLAKGNLSAVTILPEVWQAMKAARVDLSPWILPGEKETQRDAHVVALDAWLRAHGMTEDVARLPFHTLRKMYGDAMESTHGLEAARKALGHSSDHITRTTYAGNITRSGVQVF